MDDLMNADRKTPNWLVSTFLGTLKLQLGEVLCDPHLVTCLKWHHLDSLVLTKKSGEGFLFFVFVF